ncbi:hypothetical protein RYO59_000053 [Thermosynechococcaceae cyanobacterium Okahandja]
MPLRSVVLLVLVAGSVAAGVIPSRADDDVRTTLTGKMTSILEDDEVMLEANNQSYKLDLPDACKPALRNGELKVGTRIIVSGELDRGDREMDVNSVRMGNRQVCP